MTSSVIALPPHGIHFHINNRFRDNNEDAWNFKIPTASIQLNQGYYLMQIKQVVTENFIRTIQPGLNDIFAVQVNGQIYEVLIPTGYYSVDTLVAALNAFLATINAQLLLTYDYDFRKLSISVPANTIFQFYSPVLNISYQYRNDYPSRYDRLLSMLGFLDVANTNFTGATVVQATNEINLKYTTTIRLISNQHLDVVGTDNQNNQVLLTIPVDVDFGEILWYEPSQPRTFALNTASFDGFRISVLDDFNNRLTVPEYTNLSISLTLLNSTTPFI